MIFSLILQSFLQGHRHNISNYWEIEIKTGYLLFLESSQPRELHQWFAFNIYMDYISIVIDGHY